MYHKKIIFKKTKKAIIYFPFIILANLPKVGLWCLEVCLAKCLLTEDPEPVFCTLTCGIGGFFGLKVSYDSAKVAYKVYLRPVFDFIRAARNNNGNPPALP